MSEFEFISVLMSMILGIGLAQLLRGVAQAVYERKSAPLDVTHLTWTGAVFLNLVLNWWVLFTWKEHELWTFSVFLALIIWAVTLYLPIVFLYPPRKTLGESWSSVYASNRQWFLGGFTAMAATDIWVTSLRGAILDPPIYLPFVGHYLILWGVGVFVAAPKYQKFLAWYTLLSLSTWSLIVRRFLG